MYGQRDHSLEEMKDITPAMDRQKDFKGKRLQEGWPFEKLHYSDQAEFTRNMEAKQVDGIRWRLDLLSACDASQWFAEVGEVKGCSCDIRTIVLQTYTCHVTYNCPI